ncbi:hypothetical protein Dda_2540 [Drechslerella dactyloides]|uniref:Uncharacterized protein n=1 Tax=Drechslerella dactyloides TaxID=74499 RepID=A0AAD6J069_DREDA|nr:hypothetical protein Dda_2540 [Drechslerella dactyloides]
MGMDEPGTRLATSRINAKSIQPRDNAGQDALAVGRTGSSRDMYLEIVPCMPPSTLDSGAHPFSSVQPVKSEETYWRVSAEASGARV